jgi:hypothetical protein
MATRKRGCLTVAKFHETRRHLRPSGKRFFWRRERKQAKREAHLAATTDGS